MSMPKKVCLQLLDSHFHLEESGCTPLLAAVNHNHWKVFEYLLSANADPNVSGRCMIFPSQHDPDHCGWTPLHLAILNIMCTEGFPVMKYVERLVSAGLLNILSFLITVRC